MDHQYDTGSHAGPVIPGGCILLARRMLKSGIMEAPPLYLKLFIWMLLKARYKDEGNGGLKRGQLFTTLEGMQKAMTYKVGYRKMRPTIKEIRGATKVLMKGHMVGTTKVTRGTIITICNYSHYQDFSNYEGQHEGHNEGQLQGRIDKKKEKKEGKTPPDLSVFKSRYTRPELIDQALEAIAATRKGGRVADSVVAAQLQKWAGYPPEQVEAGVQTYLEKGCAAEGKGEKYLLGIIRNQKPGASISNKPATPEWF